jgi:hypothetical protein
VELQPRHIDALVELAAEEVKTALAEIEEVQPAPMKSGWHEFDESMDESGAAYLERPDVDESGVPYLIRPTTTETVKWSDTSAGDPFPYAGQSGVGPAVAFPAPPTEPWKYPAAEHCKYTESD